jgi:Putative peptidoglycan binding domain
LALALSRIRTGSIPLRGPFQRFPGKTIWQRLAGPLKAEHLRLYLGAGLAIAVVGISVNALLFQHERHPAPLFGSPLPPATPAGRAPAASPAPRPASVEREASAAPPPANLPPARPADAADGSAAAPSDPITDLLRGEAHVDGAHLIMAAQTALAKLGYPVKPDGNDGLATQQALRDFERVHGLPPSTEITPRLLKQLTLAARAGGR